MSTIAFDTFKYVEHLKSRIGTMETRLSAKFDKVIGMFGALVAGIVSYAARPILWLPIGSAQSPPRCSQPSKRAPLTDFLWVKYPYSLEVRCI